MSRDRVLTDAQWVLLERLLPSSKGKQSRPFRDHRQVIEDIVFRFGRDVRGGPGRAVRALADRVEASRPVQQGRHLGPGHGGVADQADQADQADRAGYVDWQLSIDSTISRSISTA